MELKSSTQKGSRYRTSSHAPDFEQLTLRLATDPRMKNLWRVLLSLEEHSVKTTDYFENPEVELPAHLENHCLYVRGCCDQILRKWQKATKQTPAEKRDHFGDVALRLREAAKEIKRFPEIGELSVVDLLTKEHIQELVDSLNFNLSTELAAGDLSSSFSDVRKNWDSFPDLLDRMAKKVKRRAQAGPYVLNSKPKSAPIHYFANSTYEWLMRTYREVDGLANTAAKLTSVVFSLGADGGSLTAKQVESRWSTRQMRKKKLARKKSK